MKYWEENPQKGCSFSDILNTLEEMHEKNRKSIKLKSKIKFDYNFKDLSIVYKF